MIQRSLETCIQRDWSLVIWCLLPKIFQNISKTSPMRVRLDVQKIFSLTKQFHEKKKNLESKGKVIQAGRSYSGLRPCNLKLLHCIRQHLSWTAGLVWAQTSRLSTGQLVKKRSVDGKKKGKGTSTLPMKNLQGVGLFTPENRNGCERESW